eukprot:TRINITY_DN4374_c0_g1_i3.p1 TRINITY_DN4374_c0_g1~~TRINITY_DN4374_c0_g1_i3.p1  ORF type:complete len:312 (-),score=29.63 TRINITY_DN4374_c0_g1_i3:55-990(-)
MGSAARWSEALIQEIGKAVNDSTLSQLVQASQEDDPDFFEWMLTDCGVCAPEDTPALIARLRGAVGELEQPIQDLLREAPQPDQLRTGGPHRRKRDPKLARPRPSRVPFEAQVTLLVQFHHLLNDYKRESIVDICREGNLCGWSRSGTPGLVLCAGEMRSVSRLVHWLREQRWQTMELCGLQVVEGESPFSLPLFTEVEGSLKAWENMLAAAGVLEFYQASQNPHSEHSKLASSTFSGGITYSERRVLDDRKQSGYRDLYKDVSASGTLSGGYNYCLLYTSDAADEEDSVDLGGRRIIKQKNSVYFIGVRS